MPTIKLKRKQVEKVWGRHDLPQPFASEGQGTGPIGEIWFEHPDGSDAALLIKYLFTSEKLSIQVHPDDEAAKRAGHKGGKEEAWFILRAEPEAVIGIGLTEAVTSERLAAAARDGSIEALVDWRPATDGDFYYSPAGTIHALGPGLSLIEVQQSSDVTYRLYDYGRARELHLQAAVEVAIPKPFHPVCATEMRADGREILASGRAFVLERWCLADGFVHPAPGRPVWLVPVSGKGLIGRDQLLPGEVWFVEDPERLVLETGSELLVAYPGGEVINGLIGDDAVRSRDGASSASSL